MNQTFCSACIHDGGNKKDCLSPKAPYTNFVDGVKSRVQLNLEGKCQYFKKKEGE